MSTVFGSPPPSGDKTPKKLKPLTIDSLKRKANKAYKEAIKDGDEKGAKVWKAVIDAKRINISEDGAWQVAIDGPKLKCWKCGEENYPLEDVDKFWGYECSCGVRDTKLKDPSQKLNEFFGTGY